MIRFLRNSALVLDRARRWGRRVTGGNLGPRRRGRRVLAGLVGGIVLFIGALLVADWFLADNLIDSTRFAQPPDTVVVTDRHGTPLRHVRVDGVDRRWIPLRDASAHLLAAMLAVEDARFYAHRGIDRRAVVRAIVTNLIPGRRRSGASTITQQVVKLVYGRPAGVFSKVTEILRARALERIFSKEEILEQYINRVPFGDRIEGVARASEAYFGIPASQLSIAQAAMIAGIPRSPSATEPRRHLEQAIRRRNVVLSRMRAVGSIDQAAFDAAIADTPVVQTASTRPYEAPRFVEGALADWRAGSVAPIGMTLPTSLDAVLQHAAEETLSTAATRFATRGVTNSAAIVVANATGEILAYVAAAHRTPDAIGGHLDLLTRARQPGSTLKPFIYELLFERGATAATVLSDIAKPMTGAAGRWFEAQDYDGRERGPVRARVALASSLNLAALDAASRLGQDAIVERMRRLGVRTAGPASRYGAALVLGGLDVSPFDLAGAYVTLARGGTRVPLVRMRKSPRSGSAVLQPDATAVTVDILSDPRARADGFGTDLVDIVGLPRFGLKTGTSSGFHDAWAVAFTSSLTVVVWMGDPANHPLGSVSGFEAAAPVAARLLAAARARAVENGVTEPASNEPRLVATEICAMSGLRPGSRCHHTLKEHFAPGTLPTVECQAHDKNGAFVLDSQYAAWAMRRRPAGVADSFQSMPNDNSEPVIVEPSDGTRFLVDPSRGDTPIHLRAFLHARPVLDPRWEVDGHEVSGQHWTAVLGHHEIIARVGGRRSRTIHVDVHSPSDRSP